MCGEWRYDEMRSKKASRQIYSEVGRRRAAFEDFGCCLLYVTCHATSKLSRYLHLFRLYF